MRSFEPSPLPAEVETFAAQIVDAALAVHRELGPGLLEKIYETCFCHELEKRGLSFRRQVVTPIVYDELVFEEGFRIDVVVEDAIICELKAVDQVNPVWQAQTLSYMRMTGKRLGFLINFNVPKIKQWIQRFVL